MRFLVFPVAIAPLPAGAARAQDAPRRAATEIEAGTVLDLEIEPGESRSFLYRAAAEGEASVWAHPEGFDVLLEVFDASDRSVAIDDDSGGGLSAQLWIPVRAGALHRIVLRTLPTPSQATPGVPAGPGRLRLAVVETPTSAKETGLRRRVADAVAAMEQLLAGGDPKEARRVGLEVLDEVLEGGAPAGRGLVEDLSSLAHALARA